MKFVPTTVRDLRRAQLTFVVGSVIMVAANLYAAITAPSAVAAVAWGMATLSWVASFGVNAWSLWKHRQ